jgi:hypothetical protein
MMTIHSPYRSADPLGAVVSEHHVSGGQQVIRIVIGLFCLVVALDCVWLGMWPRFGVIHWGGFAVTSVIAIVFLWLAYDAFAHFARARKQRVSAHEFGIRIHVEKSPKDIRFDDMTSLGGVLWQTGNESVASGAVMWIDDVQGRRIELPSPLANALELGDSIRKATFEKRYSQAQARIGANQEVRLGRIMLDPFVIGIDGELSARSEIESARVSSRWLAVKQVGKREQLIPTEEIPNLDVLLELLRG